MALVAVVAVIVAAAIVTAGNGQGESIRGPAFDGAEVAGLLSGIPQHGLVLGDLSAPVTVFDFADLQCVDCREYAFLELPLIIGGYVRTHRVRLVLDVLPVLGKDSVRAARAAMAASDQNKLWNFAILFLHNQRPEHSGYVSPAFLRSLASAVPGLNVGRMLRDQGSREVRRQLQTAVAFARALRIRSIPRFLVAQADAAPVYTDQSTLMPAIAAATR